MGKHSARDGQDGRENRTTGAAGTPPGPVVPPDPPGSGRRRRGSGAAPLPGVPAGPTGTGGFAAVRPQDLDGPLPAHPEHREHTAWGAPGGWAAAGGHGSGGRRGSGSDPLESWAEVADPRAAVLPRQVQVAGRAVPRPRQEFLDAFDAPPGPPQSRGPQAALAGPGPAAGPAGDGDRDDGRGSGGSGGDGDGRRDGEGGGRGRTLSGVAAAAVVTVLAVVAAGQITGGEKKHTGASGKNAATRSSGGEASPMATRDAPPGPAPTTAPTTAAPPTYEQLMAATYPLDPRLSLSGAFTTMPGHQRAPGHGTVMRFRVDVEKGLPLDPGLFTETVFRTLNDSRSWGHGGRMTFERVSSGPVDIVVTLASPGTTARWCAKSGLDTSIENVSCDAASTPRTMINAYRWARGATTYGPELMHEYRQMLINHEVGHRLGHGHVGCPRQGALAPVMMQQTKFLSVDGGPLCRPNPWPYP